MSMTSVLDKNVPWEGVLVCLVALVALVVEASSAGASSAGASSAAVSVATAVGGGGANLGAAGAATQGSTRWRPRVAASLTRSGGQCPAAMPAAGAENPSECPVSGRFPLRNRPFETFSPRLGLQDSARQMPRYAGGGGVDPGLSRYVPSPARPGSAFLVRSRQPVVTATLAGSPPVCVIGPGSARPREECPGRPAASCRPGGRRG